MQSLAGLLGIFFIWVAGQWIHGVNSDILTLKSGLVDLREEQLINFLWLSDHMGDEAKARELRAKIYDLRVNRK